MFDLANEKLDDIPEALRPFAKQIDGKHVVNLVPAAKLAEFRDNNIQLSRDKETLSAFKKTVTELIGTEDLAAFSNDLATLREVDKQVKDGKLKTEKGLEAVLEERTREMKTSFEKQLKEAGEARVREETSRKNYETKYKRTLISNAITEGVLNLKTFHETALPVVLKEAYDVFRVDEANEKVVPYAGDAILYGADGVTPMGVTDWLKKLGETMPFLLKESSGGGAGGGNGKLKGVDVNKLTPAQKMSMGRQQNSR